MARRQAFNIPVDAVIMPKSAKAGDFPLLIEAKSAGDFTNINKRRKEETVKMTQLRCSYGAARFALPSSSAAISIAAISAMRRPRALIGSGSIE